MKEKLLQWKNKSDDRRKNKLEKKKKERLWLHQELQVPYESQIHTSESVSALSCS